MPINTEEKANEIRQLGFCILRRHFPQSLMQACNQAFAPILRNYLESRANADPNRGPNRHYIPLPLNPPFYDPRIFDDDSIAAIITQILGDGPAIAQYASDTPLEHSVHQQVHADLQPLFHEDPDLFYPPAVLAVNFPFVDITPARGPFEVARATHLLPREKTLRQIEAGEIPLEPLLLNAGDVLIRDPRCLHRGSPNRTNTPRVVAVIGYQRQWMRRAEQLLHDSPMPQSVWENLSAREKDHFRLFEHLVAQGP